MRYLGFLTLIVTGISIAAIDGEWKGYSHPSIMSSEFTYSFKDLPLEGSLLSQHRKLWSGPYWPNNKGGINIRWNTSQQEGFKYQSPSREEVRGFSSEQIASLSPTEKYDIFLGRYDFPLKEEAKRKASKHAKDWAGICHGWAPASLHHEEPTPKVMSNPDGIQIPFGSADIKALLSYYYAFYHTDVPTRQVGLRCYVGSWLGGTVRGCDEDLNAGAFHVIISNKLGILKEGFLMDVERFNQVWNQPLVGYRSRIVDAHLPAGKKAAKNAVKEVRIATELFYVDESDAQWNVVYGTQEQKIAKKDLLYRAEIDATGKIVGGMWESKERPDFFWSLPKVNDFEGLFQRLPELLND